MDLTTVHIGTFFTMSFYKGIFIIRLDRDIKGSPAQAREWINCMEDMKEHLGRPFPLMTEVKHKVEFTSQARMIMRSVEDEEYLIAHAMWAHSLSMKAMVKFLMILVPRNRFEEEVFLQESNALAWLKKNINRSLHAKITEEEASNISIQIRQEN